MKIIYVIPEFSCMGGKGRVIANKVKYMVEKWNAEIILVTSDQSTDEPLAYDLPDEVRVIHLNINYKKRFKRNIILNKLSQLKCVTNHRKQLQNLFATEKPDIVVSTFTREMTWLYKIKDGSKKVLEYHFNKDTLKEAPRKHWLLWLKYWQKIYAIKHYDAFVVLSQEDKKDWGDIKNMHVIPNSLTFYPKNQSDLSQKRILAVGRLVPQKGFDRLIDIWAKIENILPEWKLTIIGSGEDLKKLEERIILNHLKRIEILPETKDIQQEYLSSSIYVMTSHYEGFPMVLHEAMSCGLPVISYACKCGPRDIINNGEDGFLIEDGNQKEFIDYLLQLMQNDTLRLRMGKNARLNIVRFSEEKVMEQWKLLFEKSVIAIT